MTVEIVDAEKRIIETGTELEKKLAALEVTDQASYDAANHLLEDCNTLLAAIGEAFDPTIKAAHEAHKTALAAKKKRADPVEALKRELSRKMTAWYQAEQKRIAEARREAEEKARKEAEERRLAEAAELAKAGMEEAADAALEAPLDIQTADFPRAPAAAAGVSYRSNWKAEVVDLMTLVKAVAAGQAPVVYLEANMSALNQAAKAFKNTQQIPGVRQINEIVQSKRYA